MNQCSDNHEAITYVGNECPLCVQREAMDAALDEQTDIDEQNIMTLFKEVKKLQKRIRALENYHGLITVKRHWWSRR